MSHKKPKAPSPSLPDRPVNPVSSGHPSGESSMPASSSFASHPHASPIPGSSYYPEKGLGHGYPMGVPRAPQTDREWMLGLQGELTTLVKDSEDLKHEMREGFREMKEGLSEFKKEVSDQMSEQEKTTEQRVRSLEDAKLVENTKMDRLDSLEDAVTGKGGVCETLVVMSTQLKTLKWVSGVLWPVLVLIISFVIAPLAKDFFASPKKDVTNFERKIEGLEKKLREERSRKYNGRLK